MMLRLAFWLALKIVAAAAVLVPASTRADWRREWDAELRFRLTQLQRRRTLTWSSRIDLVRRALGSLPDAAWIRRQFTLDADAVHDAMHGIRMLLKAPGFTAINLLVFAIGIGAATAIVSIADALFLRPLPVRQPEHVMTIWQSNRETGQRRLDVAPGNALEWLQRAQSFGTIAAVEPWRLSSNIAGREPEYLTAAFVGAQFFEVLGAPMFLGRAFLLHEYHRGGGRVAVLSYPMWKERLGGDASVVGRALRLDDGDTYMVVGVMPLGLELRLFDNRLTQPEPLVWLPKQEYSDVERSLRGTGYWNVLGRLRPGVSQRQAQAEFDAISTQLAREFPKTNAKIAAEVVPLRSHLLGSLHGILPLLSGAAAILLLVACANVASLLLARGAARGREFAVRQALGATRLRLLRQMLVETLLLAAAGGALGLAFTRWTLDAFAALRPGDIALVDRIPIDARAAVIACAVTILAALLAGLAPSVRLSRAAAASALKEGRGSSNRLTRGALVVAEVAAALVLTVGAGLLVRSFILIQRVDPGFSRDDVSIVQVFAAPRLDTPQKRMAFFDQALDRFRALPGVVAAGGVTSMPFGEARVIIRGPLAINGRPTSFGEDALVHLTAVSGDYFQATGVPLLEGRLLDETDRAASRHVVVVSRSAAQQFWPHSEPVGSKVTFRFTGTAYDAEVVGVVGDMRHEALDRPAAAEVFLPYSQSGFYALTLVVRTAPEAPVNLQTLKEQIWAIDPLQSIFHTGRLDQLISKTLIARRFTLFLLGSFALATLLLASSGVYGIISFLTGQRTREFSVRIALGAQRRDIVRLVLGDGLRIAGAGIVVGLALAIPLVEALRTFLFGVTPTDPLTFLVVSVALLVVAAGACYAPAMRSLKLGPAKTLRVD